MNAFQQSVGPNDDAVLAASAASFVCMTSRLPYDSTQLQTAVHVKGLDAHVLQYPPVRHL